MSFLFRGFKTMGVIYDCSIGFWNLLNVSSEK